MLKRRWALIVCNGFSAQWVLQSPTQNLSDSARAPMIAVNDNRVAEASYKRRKGPVYQHTMHWPGNAHLADGFVMAFFWQIWRQTGNLERSLRIPTLVQVLACINVPSVLRALWQRRCFGWQCALMPAARDEPSMLVNSWCGRWLEPRRSREM